MPPKAKAALTGVRALGLMQSNRSVKDRAESYTTSIARNLEKEILDPLIDEKAKIEQKLFDLKDFTLDTNLNAGQARMTIEQCQARFKEIIELEYRLVLLNMELEVKQKSYEHYFVVDEA